MLIQKSEVRQMILNVIREKNLLPDEHAAKTVAEQHIDEALQLLSLNMDWEAATSAAFAQDAIRG